MMQSSTDVRKRHEHGRFGFTLIELLVVISIIALLVSILLPSLSKAREAARTTVCGTTLKGLGTGLNTYFNEFSEWIPGMNTSGVSLRAKQAAISSNADALHDPNLPVQPQDWISPVLGLEMDLSSNRAKRMRTGTETYMCPSQFKYPSVLYGVNNAADADDFLQYQEWSAVSYLMPASFQFWGQSSLGQTLAYFDNLPKVPVFGVRAQVGNSTWEVVADNYVSRLNRVGGPGSKIMVADGTRYLSDPDVSLLDHDINPLPTYFGSYTSSGAWWSGSTAYGVEQGSMTWDNRNATTGSPSQGRNLALTYRHGNPQVGQKNAMGNKGTINALFFDNHVEQLSDRASRRIEYWYPRGSRVNDPNAGLIGVENNFVIP